MSKIIASYGFTGAAGTIFVVAKEVDHGEYTVYMGFFTEDSPFEGVVEETLEQSQKVSRSWAAAIFPYVEATYTYRP